MSCFVCKAAEASEREIITKLVGGARIMTALDTLTTAIALMSAAAGPEASEAAMRRDDADWWHLCREADRRAASRPVDAKTLRARRLLADDISYDRAYGEIMRDRPAPEAMVDALVFSLRRGVGELPTPDTQRRLSELDADQLKAACRRVQNFKPEIAPPWSPDEVAALIAARKDCQ
jgi:hypothetical protein